MPYNFFKSIKIKCNYCNSIVQSKSDKEWSECSCGNTKVKGKSFMTIQGDNYTNLSLVSTDNIPPHRGWDDTRENYYNKDNNEN